MKVVKKKMSRVVEKMCGDKMKKILCVLLCVIVVSEISACGDNGGNVDGMIRTTTGDLQKLPQEIQDILFGDGRFYDVEENKEFSRATLQMTDCDTDSSTDVLWNEFLVADVDQDGAYELAVHMTGKDEECLMEYDVLMFHLSEGTVYAHPYSFRSITGVYENGVVLGSSGAADNVWYHIQYDKEVESQTVEAYSETAYTEGEGARIHYYIDGEMVPEGTFYEYIGEKYGIENMRGENAKILWSGEKINGTHWGQALEN